MPSSYIYNVAKPELEHISVLCQIYAPNHLIILLYKLSCVWRFKLSKLFCTLKPSLLGDLSIHLLSSRGRVEGTVTADGITVGLSIFLSNLLIFSSCTNPAIYLPSKNQQLSEEKSSSVKDHLRGKIRRKDYSMYSFAHLYCLLV